MYSIWHDYFKNEIQTNGAPQNREQWNERVQGIENLTVTLTVNRRQATKSYKAFELDGAGGVSQVPSL